MCLPCGLPPRHAHGLAGRTAARRTKRADRQLPRMTPARTRSAFAAGITARSPSVQRRGCQRWTRRVNSPGSQPRSQRWSHFACPPRLRLDGRSPPSSMWRACALSPFGRTRRRPNLPLCGQSSRRKVSLLDRSAVSTLMSLFSSVPRRPLRALSPLTSSGLTPTYFPLFSPHSAF